MAINRYNIADIVKGSGFTISTYTPRIKKAIDDGTLDYTLSTMVEGKRLDTIAGEFYGDARLWWIIAAASSIGWALQVPPNTVLRIPTDLGQVISLLGL